MTASRSLSFGSEPLMLQTVEDALQRFRTALTERDRPFEEPLFVLYRHTDYSVSMLREYFQNGRAGLDRETAEILADHLHATVGKVIEIAKEIDNEYASPADSSWRRPRTGRDSQGAASLQPRDLHTLLHKRPRAADPIVEITGLVVRGVGQIQQRTVSVKLNDESAPATQLPEVKRVGDGRQIDHAAWYDTALDARRPAVINADDGVARLAGEPEPNHWIGGVRHRLFSALVHNPSAATRQL